MSDYSDQEIDLRPYIDLRSHIEALLNEAEGKLETAEPHKTFMSLVAVCWLRGHYPLDFVARSIERC